MKLLLLKAPKIPEDSYEKELKLSGHEPYFIKVLHFEFLNSDRLFSALRSSSNYSGIVFTSQTAVEACEVTLSRQTPDSLQGQAKNGEEELSTEVMQNQLLEKEWSSLPVFVVGKATAAAVGRLGFKTSSGATSGNAEELSKLILQYFECRSSSSCPPLLFPCSCIRRDTLPSALSATGLKLDEVPCYDTVPHPQMTENFKAFADLVMEEEAVGVVFFSPSGVSYALQEILHICREQQITVQFMAIGKTTAEALSQAGHAPSVVALSPSPSGLLAAINQMV